MTKEDISSCQSKQSELPKAVENQSKVSNEVENQSKLSKEVENQSSQSDEVAETDANESTQPVKHSKRPGSKLIGKKKCFVNGCDSMQGRTNISFFNIFRK